GWMTGLLAALDFVFSLAGLASLALPIRHQLRFLSCPGSAADSSSASADAEVSGGIAAALSSSSFGRSSFSRSSSAVAGGAASSKKLNPASLSADSSSAPGEPSGGVACGSSEIAYSAESSSAASSASAPSTAGEASMNLKTPRSSSLAAAGSTGKANSPESSSASADSASKGKVMSFVLSPEFSGAGVAMPSSKFNSARSMLAIGESESTAATSSPSLSGSCNVRSSGCESASSGVAVDSSAPRKPKLGASSFAAPSAGPSSRKKSSPAISSESDVATGGMSAAG